MFISFDCLVLVLVIYIALLSHLACCAGEIPNVYGCRGSVGVLCQKRQFPELVAAAKSNVERLVSSFDIHKTLQHLLHLQTNVHDRYKHLELIDYCLVHLQTNVHE